MADQTQYVAAIGPLCNVSLVVLGVAFTAFAWSNGLELMIEIFTYFRKHSTYFSTLLVATAGILCDQSAVFCMTFAPAADAYGVIVSIDVGWTYMVTGQSMVLWTRLYLVCQSQWKLRAVLAMIVSNAILCHGAHWAVQDNAMNPDYPPLIYTKKVSLCFFFAQEVIISSFYVWEASRVLHLVSMVKHGSKYRRMRNLIIASIAILALDVGLLNLEFAALWGAWCTFKGFAYSTKLKIEFAILSQLRSSITGVSTEPDSTA